MNKYKGLKIASEFVSTRKQQQKETVVFQPEAFFCISETYVGVMPIKGTWGPGSDLQPADKNHQKTSSKDKE